MSDEEDNWLSVSDLPGIYQIKCLINNKIYIGGATSTRERKYSHKHHLINNTHRNQYLQRAWNKYGESLFEFIVLEIIFDKTKLIEREQHWIDKTNCCDRNIGYNLAKIAGRSMLGMKVSDETKAKISAAQIGRPRKGTGHLGHKHSLEAKRKISEAGKGRIVSEEAKLNMSLALKGKKKRPRTEEHNRNQSIAQKRKIEFQLIHIPIIFEDRSI